MLKNKNKKFSNSPFWLNKITKETKQGKNDFQGNEEWEYWHSISEYKCYLHLHQLKQEHGFSIHRQQKIDILPKDEHFNKLSWNVDFLLKFSSQVIIPVECKGEWLLHDAGHMKSFILLMRMLSIHQPMVFQQLIIVGSSSWVIPNSRLQVYDYKDFSSCLLTKRLR